MALDFGPASGLPLTSQPRPSTDAEIVKMAQKAALSHVPRPPSDFGQKGRSPIGIGAGLILLRGSNTLAAVTHAQ
ncbi:MAG: hypothetical protein C5B50_17940 [Verrucomicrobia bacterium]|nr:MAG: hypothetical protein C5B50_17940 [Verrucomicrobiota bacterium]